MRTWDVKTVAAKPRQPEILSSTDEARAIAIDLPAGDVLQDHEVHERAWVVVIEGEVELTTTAGERILGAPGTLVEFFPRERHEVAALEDSRILLLLTPWPGSGHPGAMTIEQKADVRRRAKEKRKQ